MFVAVYDKTKDVYFKSYVYGIINSGFYSKYIIHNPNTHTFYTVLLLDIEDRNNNRKTFINIIDPRYDGFISLNKADVKMLNKKLNLNGEGNILKNIVGYEDLLNDIESLSHILTGGEVHRDKVNFKFKEDFFAGDDWIQIDTQQGADELLKVFTNFHDAILESFSYLGESKMINSKMEMEGYGKRRNLSMIFHSSWYGKIELCFDGVILMQHRPAGDNYSDEIFGATLLVKEGKVYWADEELGNVDLDYKGTFVYAFNLRWRTLFKLDKSWKENFK